MSEAFSVSLRFLASGAETGPDFVHGINFQLPDTFSGNAVTIRQGLQGGFLITQPATANDILATLIQFSQALVQNVVLMILHIRRFEFVLLAFRVTYKLI